MKYFSHKLSPILLKNPQYQPIEKGHFHSNSFFKRIQGKFILFFIFDSSQECKNCKMHVHTEVELFNFNSRNISSIFYQIHLLDYSSLIFLRLNLKRPKFYQKYPFSLGHRNRNYKDFNCFDLSCCFHFHYILLFSRSIYLHIVLITYLSIPNQFLFAKLAIAISVHGFRSLCQCSFLFLGTSRQYSS